MSNLREAIVKLAKEVPETRKHLVPLLRVAARSSFDDAVRDKNSETQTLGTMSLLVPSKQTSKQKLEKSGPRKMMARKKTPMASRNW